MRNNEMSESKVRRVYIYIYKTVDLRGWRGGRGRLRKMKRSRDRNTLLFVSVERV